MECVRGAGWWSQDWLLRWVGHLNGVRQRWKVSCPLYEIAAKEGIWPINPLRPGHESGGLIVPLQVLDLADLVTKLLLHPSKTENWPYVPVKCDRDAITIPGREPRSIRI